jgi:hypothetical protein
MKVYLPEAIQMNKHTFFQSPELQMGNEVHWRYEDYDVENQMQKLTINDSADVTIITSNTDNINKGKNNNKGKSKRKQGAKESDKENCLKDNEQVEASTTTSSSSSSSSTLVKMLDYLPTTKALVDNLSRAATPKQKKDEVTKYWMSKASNTSSTSLSNI